MEYNHKGKVTARYVHGLGIDEPLAVDHPIPLLHKEGSKGRSNTYYYHADGLGSITALTDSKGKVVQRYDYDSFGNLKHHGHKVKQPYTYTAREWDKKTKLYYYRARYYDAKVGRFISVDPVTRGFNHVEGISCRQSINRFPLDKPKKLHPFVYTENNPINYVDPKGLACGPGYWGDWVFPDIIWGTIDLTPACSGHDDCYADCTKTKYECDEKFLKDLKTICSNVSIADYPDCITVSYIYYWGVLTPWGQNRYDNAQKEKCCK